MSTNAKKKDGNERAKRSKRRKTLKKNKVDPKMFVIRIEDDPEKSK